MFHRVVLVSMRVGRRPRSPSESSGQSTVEFALVLPLLALIVMGMIDLGRVFYTYGALANAAREGARFCALNLGDTTGTRARIAGDLGGRVTVDLTGVTCPAIPTINPGDMVTTALQATFAPITPLVARFSGDPSGTFAVRASASMEAWCPPQV